MENINLAISCAGSGIGQSIIDSCKLSNLPITTFGLDGNSFAFGIYDCDHQIKTPKITAPSYITTIIDICVKHEIHIIIPGIDDEVHLFSKHIEDFNKKGIKVIVSDASFLDLVRDKVKTNRKLSEFADIFVKSYYNKDEFVKGLEKGEVSFPVIAKPVSGSGSLGVHILNELSDFSLITEQHIIQEIARPNKNDKNVATFEQQIHKKINAQVSELSIHLVADKNGDVIGRMASYNRLKNGIPVEIIPYKGQDVWEDIEKILPALKSLGLRGPLNIQGRMTDEGLKIFEMNARFTGITGLRACMGFNEVETCVKLWLDVSKDAIDLNINNNVFGVRQITNKVVSLTKNEEAEEILNQINNSYKKQAKTLLLTGATGFLGQNLIDQLMERHHNYSIWALVRDKKKAKSLLPNTIKLFDHADFEDGTLSIGLVDTLMHLGFARPHKSVEDIADSLSFTSHLFRNAVENHVSNIINISSQSVYGQVEKPLWNERSTIAPSSPYAVAKYSTELALKTLSNQHKNINTTSIRLAGVIGGAKGLINIDLVSKFVEKIRVGDPLKVVGGMQEFERLDIRDAVSGLIALLETPGEQWKSVYNFGAGHTFTLLELANKTVEIGKTFSNLKEGKIEFEEKQVDMKFGMDSNQFYKDTNWKPKYNIDDIIQSLFEFDYL